MMGYRGQMPMAWHNGGLFMGLHWAWWLLWLVLLLVLVWGFWRFYADRSDVRREVGREEAAEAVLRKRFAAGEIDEDEYERRLKILRDTHLGL